MLPGESRGVIFTDAHRWGENIPLLGGTRHSVTCQFGLETRDGEMSQDSEFLNLSDLPDEFALLEDGEVVVRKKHPTKNAHKAKCKLGGLESAKNRVTKIYEKIGENRFQIIYQDSGGSHAGHKARKGEGPGSTII